MKNNRKRKIHRVKNGLEFIKETYFIGDKTKFLRIYVIGGILAYEFYEKNATGLDFYLYGDYELMNSKNYSKNHFNEKNSKEPDSPNNEDLKDFPF